MNNGNYDQTLSYVVAASAPTHAFLDFLIQTKFHHSLMDSDPVAEKIDGDEGLVIVCLLFGGFIGFLAMVLTLWGIKRRLQTPEDKENDIETGVEADKIFSS